MSRAPSFRSSALIALALPLAAAAQDAERGKLLYDTHCGECHYERVHERLRSEVKDLRPARRGVALVAEDDQALVLGRRAGRHHRVPQRLALPLRRRFGHEAALMRITFLGAAGEVTGSCFLVDTGELKFLVDCGMFQGGRSARAKNRRFGFDPREIAFVLLTHAHIDHSGLLPRLVAQGFAGPVYATPATCDLQIGRAHV